MTELRGHPPNKLTVAPGRAQAIAVSHALGTPVDYITTSAPKSCVHSFTVAEISAT